MADLSSYIEAGRRAETDYQNPSAWAVKAILNVARVGVFSSDRTIREYARDIWNIRPALAAEEPANPRSKDTVSAEVLR